MTSFAEKIARLEAEGYANAPARAKLAHDVVLKAMEACGFSRNVTIKGGVVMSSLTDIARRATMDMDFDFLRYPLSNDAIRKFVSGLNRVAPCRIRISGNIETTQAREAKHVKLASWMRFSK